jgi:hypothetical protein
MCKNNGFNVAFKLYGPERKELKNILREYEYNNKGILYIWVNLINGKKYIGSSKVIINRMNQYFYSIKSTKNINKDNPILSAMIKYGIENFGILILEP